MKRKSFISEDKSKFAFIDSINASNYNQTINIKSLNGTTVSTDATFSMYYAGGSSNVWAVNSDFSMIAYNHDPASGSSHPHVIRVQKLNSSTGSYDQLADIERPSGWTSTGDNTGIWRSVKILSDTRIVVGTITTHTTATPQLHVFDLSNNSWSLSGTFTFSGNYTRIYDRNLILNEDGSRLASHDYVSEKIEFFELDYDNFTVSSFLPDFSQSLSSSGTRWIVNENLDTIASVVPQGSRGNNGWLQIHKYNSSSNSWVKTNDGEYLNSELWAINELAISHDGNVIATYDHGDNYKLRCFYYDHPSDEWIMLGSAMSAQVGWTNGIAFSGDGKMFVTRDFNNTKREIKTIDFTRIYY